MAIDFDKYILSAGTHYISNSGSDENGAYHGGKAGDQTGREWQLKAWYSRPWTVVLRHPDQAVALCIARLGVAAALNNAIGYDQYQRTTYWQRLQAAGYDPTAITVACEADCTAGVSANVRAAGHIRGIRALQDIPICTSRDMRSAFTGAGFQALTASKYLNGSGELLPGDILLYENHHAATNITLGKNARGQWHPDTIPEAAAEAAPSPRVTTTGSVHIRKGPNVDYDSMGTVAAGCTLPYFGYTAPNGWLLVEYQRSTGWVSGKYAKVEAA